MFQFLEVPEFGEREFHNDGKTSKEWIQNRINHLHLLDHRPAAQIVEMAGIGEELYEEYVAGNISEAEANDLRDQLIGFYLAR